MNGRLNPVMNTKKHAPIGPPESGSESAAQAKIPNITATVTATHLFFPAAMLLCNQ